MARTHGSPALVETQRTMPNPEYAYMGVKPIDQPLQLTNYNAAWSDRFEEQQARLTDLLKPRAAGETKHIGSTPVAAGYFWLDDANYHYHLWFLRLDSAARTYHLQIIQSDHRGVLADRNAYSNAKLTLCSRSLKSIGSVRPSRKPM
jgi:hypothetical protein